MSKKVDDPTRASSFAYIQHNPIADERRADVESVLQHHGFSPLLRLIPNDDPTIHVIRYEVQPNTGKLTDLLQSLFSKGLLPQASILICLRPDETESIDVTMPDYGHVKSEIWWEDYIVEESVTPIVREDNGYIQNCERAALTPRVGVPEVGTLFVRVHDRNFYAEPEKKN